jgi:hypothetical protein
MGEGTTAYGGTGGAAMYRGANYQALVATYFAALGLAESRNGVPPEIPAPVPPSRVGAEQHWPIDDTAVWFGETATTWLQAKASINAAGLPDVLEQFVGQFVHGHARAAGTPLGDDDRLVLVVEDAPEWIGTDLRDLLRQIAMLRQGDPVTYAFQGETRLREAYERVAPVVRAALASTGERADDAQVLAVLRAARVWRKGADDLRAAATLTLDHYVVADSAQVPAALAVLENHFAQAGEGRLVADVTALRRLLVDAGIRLKAPPSVAPDVDRLVAGTVPALQTERTATVLRAHEGEVRVDRAVTVHLVRALSVGNIAVVGEAGAGKSGVLVAAATQLTAAGEQVVFIDATDSTMSNPDAGFRLERRLGDVLTAWTDDGRAAYVFVDGLDRTRVGDVYGAILRLVRELRTRGAAVRFAIATREYDLQYAPELRDELPFDPAQGVPASVRDAERFGSVAHVFVRSLDVDEMQQVTAVSPSLGALVATAPPDAQLLLRNPFNLSIAAALMLDGDVVDLSAVRDRTDLMRLWWQRRIQRGAGLAKEGVLRSVAQQMLGARRLRVPVEVLSGSEADEQLLSDGVIVRIGRDGLDVAFAHAVMFDYVVARLLLGRENAIATLLGADRDAFLFVLPSIRMRFVELWRRNPDAFYAEIAALFAEGNQRRTLLLVAARIVVENLQSAADVLPLFERDDPAYLAAVRFVVRNVIHVRELGASLVGERAGPWAEIVLEMARRLPRHEHDTLLLLHELLAGGPPTAVQAATIAEAARLALAQQLDREPYDERLMRMAIEAFIGSYDIDPNAGRPLRERLLDHTRLAEYAKYELQPIADAASRLRDPDALSAIYEAAFSDIPEPTGQLTIGARSSIMGMVADAGQSISLSRYALGERFPKLLEEAPAVAVRALCAVLERQAAAHDAQAEFTVTFEGRELHLRHDYSNIWDDDVYDREPWREMAKAFETRLRDGIATADGFLDVALTALQEHAHAAYLWRIVLRNAGDNVATASRFAPFATQRGVLLSCELGEPVAQFLEAGYAKLSSPTREAVDAAILALLEGEVDEERRRWREEEVREYARAIGAEAIETDALRPYAMATSTDESPEEAQRRRALALSGSYHSSASFSRRGLDELAPPDAPARFRELLAAADPLFHSGNQAAATAEQATALPQVIRELDEVSRDAGEANRRVALDVIAALMRIGLRWDVLDAEAREAFLSLVLEGVRRQQNDEADGALAQDRFGLSTPNATDDGVQVLWRLYAFGHDERLVAALRELMHHRRSSIRAVAVEGAGVLRDVDPDLVWEIAEDAAQDDSPRVLMSADDAARAVAHLDTARYHRLRFGIYDRLVPNQPKSDYTRNLVSWAVLGTLQGDADARQRVDPVLNEPWTYHDTANSVIFDLANRLGPNMDEGVRSSAAAGLAALAQRLIAQVDSLTSQFGYNLDAYPDPQKAHAEAGFRLISEIAERVYYVAGFRPQQRVGSAEIDEQMFTLLRPILDPLASFRFARTAYFVVQTLLGATARQPAEALQLGLRAIKNGIAGGMLGEPLAESHVRAFVIRYIDEHRGLLEADPTALAELMDIVDAYVDAGWPRWIDVVFKLDAIYRGD